MSVVRMNLFFVLLFGFGLVLFTVRPTERTVIFQLLAVPLIVLFGFSLISTARKLNKKSPGLVVSPKGILENSSFFPVGLIAWNDIVSIHVQQARSTRWLMIEVRNPEQYFAPDNLLIRTFQRLNSIFGAGAIFLSASLIDIDFDEMVSLIKQYHEKYGSA